MTSIGVGIDVAKNSHECCILSSNGEVLVDGFSFENNREGFNSLISLIDKHSADEIKVALEATGHYHKNLKIFLDKNDLSPHVFNALQVNFHGKAQSLRKTKTDKADAKLIAKLALDNEEQTLTDTSYQNEELKSLTRLRKKLVRKRSREKINLKTKLDVMFPELAGKIDLDSKGARAMLMEFSSLKELANCDITELTNILKKASRGSFGEEKAIEIKEAAEKSIGNDSTAQSIEVKQILVTMDLFDEQIKEIEIEIKKIMDEIDSPILTVPGISYTLGSSILAEIVDINRFDNPGKVLAFAGLDPTTYQSGKYNSNESKMVKRGSPYLRDALMQAARQISMRDETFKAYYEKKKAEGKHHYVALTHVARKLIRVLFKLLNDDEEFVPQAS